MKPSTKKKALYWGAVILAVGLIAGLFYFRSINQDAYEPVNPGGSTGGVLPGQESEAPAPPAVGSGVPGAVEGTKRLVLYIDGWSHVSVNKAGATATPEIVDGKTEPIVWSPLDAAEISSLASTDPDLVTRLVARLASVASDFSCNADGCTGGGQTITYDQVADLTQLPGYGPAYEDQSIKVGLWVASISVPELADSVVVSAPEWNDSLFFLTGATGESEEAPAEEPVNPDVETDSGLEDIEEVLPEANNGYLKSVYPVSAAFGSVFVTNPAWIGDEPTSHIRRAALGTDMTSDSLREQLTGPTFANGLGAPSKLAEGLNSSQLTYMSSLPTNCGIGVLCYPGVVENNVTDYSVDVIEVCNAEDDSNAFMAVENSTWNFTLPGLTAIYGAWNGGSTETFEPGVTGSVVFDGYAPLISGEQTLHQSSVRLFDGNNGAVTMFASIGQMAQGGFDSEEAMARTLSADQLPDFFNGEYRTCG